MMATWLIRANMAGVIYHQPDALPSPPRGVRPGAHRPRGGAGLPVEADPPRRLLSRGLERRPRPAFAQFAKLGQPIVVENMSGANGAIGIGRLAKSAPDGYTFAIGATTNLAIGPHLNSKLPYDPLGDFAPVALLARVTIVLVVSSAVPARSVDELVALARAHPGKLNYASIGTGSTTHLLGEMLRRSAGIDIVHVPYKGIQQAVTALLAGDVQFIFFPVFGDAAAHVRSGALRPLAVVDSRRS